MAREEFSQGRQWLDEARRIFGRLEIVFRGWRAGSLGCYAKQHFCGGSVTIILFSARRVSPTLITII